jgi:hypothetical protein
LFIAMLILPNTSTAVPSMYSLRSTGLVSFQFQIN